MKFVINGTEYQSTSLEKITGRHALDLAKYAKIGVAQLALRAEEIPRLTLDDDDQVVVLPEGSERDRELGPLAVFASERHLHALLALIWMSWRLGGEDKNVPWSAMEDYPILTIGFIDDSAEAAKEAAEDDPEDPTPPSATAPVVDGEARASRRSSKGSTTSKRTSRRGS